MENKLSEGCIIERVVDVFDAIKMRMGHRGSVPLCPRHFQPLLALAIRWILASKIQRRSTRRGHTIEALAERKSDLCIF